MVVVKPGNPNYVKPEPSSSRGTNEATLGSGSKWFVLARLLRPQGRKGEVLAELLTDFPERLSSAPRVFLAPAAFLGSESEARVMTVADFWLPVGKNSGRIVLHFAGVDSISLAETLAGLEVMIPASERPELEDDANYVDDLIGCTIYDHNGDHVTVALGVITDLQFATTPDGVRRLEEAAPLLLVETPDGDEILIPFVKAFLISIDPAAKRIDMRLPEGLADVNRP